MTPRATVARISKRLEVLREQVKNHPMGGQSDRTLALEMASIGREVHDVIEKKFANDPERKRLTNEVIKAYQERDLVKHMRAVNAVDMRRAEIIGATLGEFRKMGGNIRVQVPGKVADPSDQGSFLGQVMTMAGKVIPSDWIEAANAHGGLPLKILANSGAGRSKYNPGMRLVTTHEGEAHGVASGVHELLHVMQETNTRIGKFEEGYLRERRTSDQTEPYIPDHPVFGNERVYPSTFFDRYCGKTYGPKYGQYHEILTMGMQYAINKVSVHGRYPDPEHLGFVYGLMLSV